VPHRGKPQEFAKEHGNMTIGLAFWVLWFLGFLSWMGTRWGPYVGFVYVTEVFFLLLTFFLGWHAFGFIIHA
jgi:hypothetical protein